MMRYFFSRNNQKGYLPRVLNPYAASANLGEDQDMSVVSVRAKKYLELIFISILNPKTSLSGKTVDLNSISNFSPATPHVDEAD